MSALLASFRSLGVKALEVVRSLGGAFAHRVRAALTLLGIVIGTGSIVLLASLLHGGETYLVHTNQAVSDNDIVEVHRDEPPTEQKDKTTRALSRSDAKSIASAQAIPHALVDAESSIDSFARYEGRRKRVAMVSTGASTLNLYRLHIERGRALDDRDRAEGSRVCVVGHEIWDELLRGAPLDKPGLRLEVDGRLFVIVGVLAKKPMLGATDSTYLWDRKVMIPETTYDVIYSPSHDVQRIYVRTEPARLGVGGEAAIGSNESSRDAGARSNTKGTRGVVRALLLRRHHGVVNFELNRDESGGTEEMILSVIRILLLGTGVLALVASGINIMNVMLVTVSERKKEIGLRRSIGATRKTILVQFLLEAAALSFTGALLGVLGGCVVALLVALLARSAIGYWEIAIPLWSIGLGVSLSLVMGIVFGILPAWRASRIQPIDALRAD